MTEIAEHPAERVLLTPLQVSARIGLSTSTLAKLRMTSRGPKFVKVCGASVRYPSDLLESFIASQRPRRSTSDVAP